MFSMIKCFTIEHHVMNHLSKSSNRLGDRNFIFILHLFDPLSEMLFPFRYISVCFGGKVMNNFLTCCGLICELLQFADIDYKPEQTDEH